MKITVYIVAKAVRYPTIIRQEDALSFEKERERDRNENKYENEKNM